MTLADAKDYFRTYRALARACDVTPGAINKWKKHGIPYLRQIQIEKLSDGKLKADDPPATVRSAA